MDRMGRVRRGSPEAAGPGCSWAAGRSTGPARSLCLIMSTVHHPDRADLGSGDWPRPRSESLSHRTGPGESVSALPHAPRASWGCFNVRRDSSIQVFIKYLPVALRIQR